MQAEFRSLAVGVFDRGADAERCVEELRRAGFAADQIGIIEPDADAADGTQTDKRSDSQGARAGVRQKGATGAIIGGLLGAATALVMPGIGPVIAGGILATALGGALGFTVALAGFGMSNQQATFYERQLALGRTVVTVNVAGRYQEALDVLLRGGARWVDSTNTDILAHTGRHAASGQTVEHQPPSPPRPD